MITTLGNFIFFVLGLAMCLGAVALVVMWLRRVFLWKKAQGSVVGSEYKQGASLPIIEFADPLGKPIRFTPKPDPSTPAPGPGEQVTVTFNPSNPTQAEIHGASRYAFSSILIGILGVAFTGAALNFKFTPESLAELFSLPERTFDGNFELFDIIEIVFATIIISAFVYVGVILGRHFSQKKALRESGREAVGRITGVESKKDSEGDIVYWLEYTFTTGEHGPDLEHQGKHRFPGGSDPAMMVGKEVTVRYLPDRPKVSEILELPDH